LTALGQSETKSRGREPGWTCSCVSARSVQSRRERTHGGRGARAPSDARPPRPGDRAAPSVTFTRPSTYVVVVRLGSKGLVLVCTVSVGRRGDDGRSALFRSKLSAESAIRPDRRPTHSRHPASGRGRSSACRQSLSIVSDEVRCADGPGVSPWTCVAGPVSSARPVTPDWTGSWPVDEVEPVDVAWSSLCELRACRRQHVAEA